MTQSFKPVQSHRTSYKCSCCTFSVLPVVDSRLGQFSLNIHFSNFRVFFIAPSVSGISVRCPGLIWRACTAIRPTIIDSALSFENILCKCAQAVLLLSTSTRTSFQLPLENWNILNAPVIWQPQETHFGTTAVSKE